MHNALQYISSTPLSAWYAAQVLAYALSPIDLIPDFIPILGLLDDLILLPGLLILAIKLIPAHVSTVFPCFMSYPTCPYPPDPAASMIPTHLHELS